TEQLTFSGSSDLLRGLLLSVGTHLFQPDSSRLGNRAFDVHLSSVNASLALDNDWWLFRLLGGGRREGEAEAPAPETAAIEAADTAGLAGHPDLGLMSGPRTAAPRPPRGAAGTWNASINYSLTRPRPTA